jgi:hypothetical protein
MSHPDSAWSGRLLAAAALVLCVPFAASAQQTDDWGPRAGDCDMTIGGTGVNDSDFDVGAYGIGGTLGKFLTDNVEVAVRQALNVATTDNDSDFSGSTRVALDYHFGGGRWYPLLGVNFGGAYGDVIDETFIAGAEAGVKFYAQEKTYILAMVEYQFLFDDFDDADDTFDDGQFVYFVGVGFNF